jgi:hypothetical protein
MLYFFQQSINDVWNKTPHVQLYSFLLVYVLCSHSTHHGYLCGVVSPQHGVKVQIVTVPWRVFQRGLISPFRYGKPLTSPPDVVLVRSMGATSLPILFVRRQIPAPNELPSFLLGLHCFVPPAILSHACREPLGCITHPIDV